MPLVHLDDEMLTRLAQEEILKSTKKAAARAEVAGPSGWLPPKIGKTNKRFLRNTVRGLLAANDLKDKRDAEARQRLKSELIYKRRYINASTRSLPKIEKKTKPEVSKKVVERNHVEWVGESLQIQPKVSDKHESYRKSKYTKESHSKKK